METVVYTEKLTTRQCNCCGRIPEVCVRICGCEQKLFLCRHCAQVISLAIEEYLDSGEAYHALHIDTDELRSPNQTIRFVPGLDCPSRNTYGAEQSDMSVPRRHGAVNADL